MDEEPTVDEWRRLCVLLLLQHGGETNVDDVLLTSMRNPDAYTVAWCKDPTSFSWKVRAYRTPETISGEVLGAPLPPMVELERAS